jgi:hypothetical protein
VRFKSPDGSFEAEFPGAVNVKTEPGGSGVSYLAKISDVVFGAGVKPLSVEDAALSSDALLAQVDKDVAADKTMQGLKKIVALSGHEGREYVVRKTTKRGQVDETYRLFFRGGRVYTLIVIARAGRDVALERDKFFNSFVLNGQ